MHDHVQMSSRSAGAPGFAFALQPKLLAGCNAWGNLHGDLTLSGDTSGAATRLARLADGSARPTTLRTRSGDGEETLLATNLTLPVAE